MAKKSKSEPLPKEIKKPVSDKKQEQAEKKKKALEDRKDVWATKLLAKLLRHTTREFKSQKIYKNEKETLYTCFRIHPEYLRAGGGLFCSTGAM